ncbi:MAG: hypothetical protein ACK5IQ_02180 [Bacteroidales bacterium]
MKRILIILLLFTPILLYAQKFKLESPDTERLAALMDAGAYPVYEVIYLYLIWNYDTVSQKQDVVYYENPEYGIRMFSQKFENGIEYSFEDYTEGGAAVLLTLPSTDRDNLVKWIETIFESLSLGSTKNGWNSDKSEFSPIEEDVGCFYNIRETGTHTIIKNYCGC